RVPVHQSRRRARSLLRAAGGGLLLRAGEEGGRAAARAAARAETRRAGRAEETRRGGSGAPAAARAGGGTQAAAADLAVDRAARDPARVLGDDDALRHRANPERRSQAGHLPRHLAARRRRGERGQRAAHRAAARQLHRALRRPRPGQHPVQDGGPAQRGEVGRGGALLCALGGRRDPCRGELQSGGTAPGPPPPVRAGPLMATLVVHAAGAAPSFVPLVKPLTTLASAPDSDVRVPDLRGVLAIQFDGESFIATALEGAHLVVNVKRRGQHTLADGDTMELGGTQLVFQSGERIQPPVALRRDGLSGPELATSRLAQFARQLANEPGVDSALARLLDALIEVVQADKGFVLVVNDGIPQVLKARNFQRENVADAVESLSDTIVRRVVETRQPLRIEDALHDSQFNASESVVNLKLASVMCLPLVMRGEMLGA